MPNQSRNGSAFEYAICMNLQPALQNWIQENERGACFITLVENTRLDTVKNNYESLSEVLKSKMDNAAKAGWKKILDMEPKITGANILDPVRIRVNDNRGRQGDVRDIIINRDIENSFRRGTQGVGIDEDENHWEIGISAKWNHDALKHSRLSDNIDFGEVWFGYPCSTRYWEEVNTPFSYLAAHRGERWSLLQNKIELVYKPILDAFINEFKQLSELIDDLPKRFVEYIVGRKDFYKVIANKRDRITDIQSFNLRRILNQECEGDLPIIRSSSRMGIFPDRLSSIDWINNSSNTIEIAFNRGWQFSFRIHNADSLISPTVKLDIRFAGSPFEIWAERWH